MATEFEFDASYELTANGAVAASTIMSLLLALPWNERERALTAVRHNDIFCAHCGIGEPNSPNRNCQCWNDE